MEINENPVTTIIAADGSAPRQAPAAVILTHQTISAIYGGFV